MQKPQQTAAPSLVNLLNGPNSLRQVNLSFTTVRSPVSGRVSDRRVSLGDQVTSGTTLLTTVVATVGPTQIVDGQSVPDLAAYHIGNQHSILTAARL